MDSWKDMPQFYARLPHPFAPPVLVQDAEEIAAEPETLLRIPPPYSSPVILVALTRALYDLISETARGRKPSTALQAVLTDQCPKWRRDGIYIYLAKPVPTETWAEMFRQFLDAGFLIPPVQQEPLILPAQISPGEEKRLADMLCGC
jgi:hypothetical protein